MLVAVPSFEGGVSFMVVGRRRLSVLKERRCVYKVVSHVCPHKILLFMIFEI